MGLRSQSASALLTLQILGQIFGVGALLGGFSAKAESPSVQPAASSVDAETPYAELIGGCDEGVALSIEERTRLLNKMRISIAGRAVIQDFQDIYGSLRNLVIQWDRISYSKVSANTRNIQERAPASMAPRANRALGVGICVHLTRDLPEIEHVADLSHEMTHATRLKIEVLKGEMSDVDEFVRARLASSGGEADAFAVECRVKREILGAWDALCSPYAQGENFDLRRVVADLYAGTLAASLTGESYPVLLKRQFHALARKRAMVSAVVNPLRPELK